ncbi:MAG: hypothetical protein WBO10_03700 [Pyrinomonadaceae bacterium]
MGFDETVKNLPVLFAAFLVAILFIQSGLDKVFDWKGNLEWLTGHFSKTFVGGLVPLMLVKITILELLTGFGSAAGIIYFFAAGTLSVVFYASILGALTLTGLFFGQRIAKDYPGAAVLIPYFILILIMMYLSLPRVL